GRVGAAGRSWMRALVNFDRARLNSPAVPTRSLRDHPPRDGEGEALLRPFISRPPAGAVRSVRGLRPAGSAVLRHRRGSAPDDATGPAPGSRPPSSAAPDPAGPESAPGFRAHSGAPPRRP